MFASAVKLRLVHGIPLRGKLNLNCQAIDGTHTELKEPIGPFVAKVCCSRLKRIFIRLEYYVEFFAIINCLAYAEKRFVALRFRKSVGAHSF